MLTVEQVKNSGYLILETISGSKAYGLDTASSDTDIRGVFILPKNQFYSLDYTPQVSNETNDIVYYELKRFLELLGRNNPNVMELLNLRPECVLYKDELMDMVNPDLFLSKLCEQTFANYAYSQVKKAYGLEKKIVNPMDNERKSVLDFCYIYQHTAVRSLNVFLKENNMRQKCIGLSAIPHLRNSYNLYYSEDERYTGVVKKDNANDVCLSSIPKGETSLSLLYFNKDGYSVYCKKHKEYWEWISKRNEERYNTTMTHGKNYDSKNMMHVFRLLLTAKEIATEGKVNAWRKDREFLLDIKQGKFEYEELLERAEALKNELPALYAASGLQEEPDQELVNDLLIKMRTAYYERG